jgi:hypothetical protein
LKEVFVIKEGRFEIAPTAVTNRRSLMLKGSAKLSGKTISALWRRL